MPKQCSENDIASIYSTIIAKRKLAY